MKCVILSKTKIVIINLIIYFLIFVFLTNSEICISSITNSTNIFLAKLLPSLLPYILLTELIVELNLAENVTYGFTRIVCKIFRIPNCSAPTVIMGYLLGYPNAAKYISKLYLSKKINLETANKLIKFTNNASPAYIIGTVGIAMFNNISIGIILIISHFLSSILIGISSTSNTTIIQQNNTISNSFDQISFSFDRLLKCLFNSIKTLCIIWGFTVIFSLIPTLIFTKLNLPIHILALLVGIFELSNGINMLASLSSNFTLSICLISFILSFSSLMVILQIYSFLYITGIKLSHLIYYKFLHGILSCIITFILIKLFFNDSFIYVFSSIDNITKSKPIPCIVYIFIAIITGFLLYLSTKKKR